MLTPSVLSLVIANNMSAAAAMLVAWQISAFEKRVGRPTEVVAA
jgi:hypothetical protein